MVDKDREEQFLKQVENAAKKGASKGVRNNSFISLIITIVLVLVIVLFIGCLLYTSPSPRDRG